MIVTSSQMDLSSHHRHNESTQTQESLHLYRVSRDGRLMQSTQVHQTEFEGTEVSLSERARSLASRLEIGDPDLEQQLSDRLDRQQNPPPDAGVQLTGIPVGAEGAQVRLSAEQTVDLREMRWVQGVVPLSQPVGQLRIAQDSDGQDPQLQFMKRIVEMISGKELSFVDLGSLSVSPAPAPEPIQLSSASPVPVSDPGRLGISYRYTETRVETEQTSFNGTGVIQTADGRTLNIDLTVNMSRSFMEQNSLQVEAGARLKDPLVINFEGPATELTERKYQFDIDADGIDDQISFVKSHSGFLALDKNADGVINDGSELFGALTGQGFQELAEYDQDGNGFIDEGDDIYNQLRIWVKQEDGTDQLLALGDKNIGAIYLGSAETPFEIKSSNNELLGKVRSTGVFLTEDGGSGSVQQVDLAV